MDYRVGSRPPFQHEQASVRSSSAPPAPIQAISRGAPRSFMRLPKNQTIVEYRGTAEYQKKCIQRIDRFVNTQDTLIEKLQQLAGIDQLDQDSVFEQTASLIQDCSDLMCEMIAPIPANVSEEMRDYGHSCVAMCEDAYEEITDAWSGLDTPKDNQELRAYCTSLADLIQHNRSNLCSVRDMLVSMQKNDIAAQTDLPFVPKTTEVGINTLPKVASTGTSMLRVITKDQEVQAQSIKQANEKRVQTDLRFVQNTTEIGINTLHDVTTTGTSMSRVKTKDKEVQTKSIKPANEKLVMLNANTQTPAPWIMQANHTSNKIPHKNIEDLYVSHLTQACDNAAAALTELHQEFSWSTEDAGAIAKARAMHSTLAESWLHCLDQLDAYRSTMWVAMFPITSGRLDELMRTRLLALEHFRFKNIKQVGKSFEKHGDAEIAQNASVRRIQTIVADVLPPIEFAPTLAAKEKMMRTLASFIDKINNNLKGEVGTISSFIDKIISYLRGEDRSLRMDHQALSKQDIARLLFYDFLPLAGQVQLCARDLVMIDAFDKLNFHNEFLFKTEKMAPDQSLIAAAKKINLDGNAEQRRQCDALEAVCKTVSPLSIFNELERLDSWTADDLKTMAYCVARFQFEIDNGLEAVNNEKRIAMVRAFANLKNTFKNLSHRVKADFKIKLQEVQTKGLKTTLNGHTEFLKQLNKKIENIDRLSRAVLEIK